MPNNSGGHFLPDLQYITLENGFLRGNLAKKNRSKRVLTLMPSHR
jgi:hypothetical protein